MRVLLSLVMCAGQTFMETAQAQTAPLTVVVFNYAHVPQPVLERAEREAGRIAASAGVELIWLDCSEPAGLPGGCSQSPELGQLLLHLLPASATRRFTEPHAFGFALPSDKGGRGLFAGVFWDRVAQFASPRANAPVMLGHIMAHEIGHLLLGENRHSASGIMKPDWRYKDLELATQGRLVFSGSERRRISRNLHRRPTHVAVAAPNPAIP